MKDECVTRLFAIAKLLMPAFEETHRSDLGSRRGICFGIRAISKKVNSPIFTGIVGGLPSEKFKEKEGFMREKINRMKSNDEYCSFESEDEENKQFGGGIRATNYFIAASGFPPHLDQKFSIMVALMAGELSVQNYEQIMNLSFHKVNAWRRKNGEKAITLSEF